MSISTKSKHVRLGNPRHVYVYAILETYSQFDPRLQIDRVKVKVKVKVKVPTPRPNGCSSIQSRYIDQQLYYNIDRNTAEDFRTGGHRYFYILPRKNCSSGACISSPVAISHIRNPLEKL